LNNNKMFRLAPFIAGAAAVHLTKDNYDELTAGRTVFIKMYAPWCGHCKSMAPAWETLTTEWEGKDGALVAEVDCTSDEGKPVCDANGVQGFPTIKWGDPAALEDYQGGRDLEAFRTFAEENLKPQCSPANIDLCTDEKKAQIEELMALSGEMLDEKIKTQEGEMEKAEADFKELVEKLQKKYERANKKKDKKLKEIKDSGLGLMKSVRAHAAKASKQEL
jgi:protein disulfide-isomerase-like protein